MPLTAHFYRFTMATVINCTYRFPAPLMGPDKSTDLNAFDWHQTMVC